MTDHQPASPQPSTLQAGGMPDWRRRDFLGRMALLAGALVFSSPTGLFAGTAMEDAVPRRHRAVIHFVKRYSRRFRIAGASPTRISKSRTLRVVVRIENMPRLEAALAALPFGRVMAAGNTLSFKHRGRQIVIENLPPGDFSARVAQLQSLPAAGAPQWAV